VAAAAGVGDAGRVSRRGGGRRATTGRVRSATSEWQERVVRRSAASSKPSKAVKTNELSRAIRRRRHERGQVGVGVGKRPVM